MNTQVEIKDFVAKRFIDDYRQSCLVMALENARILSGRTKCCGESRKALNTGTVIPDVLSSKFIKDNELIADTFTGLIHYLMLLDLIGNSLKPKSEICTENNVIFKALTYFSPIKDEKEKWAIVALRNCLAHNYGLVNKSKYENSQHKFSLLLNNGTNKMIQFPATPWKNGYSKKDKSLSTEIDVCKLIDAIEETYKKLKDMAEKGELDLCLKDGKNELEARFTISTK